MSDAEYAREGRAPSFARDVAVQAIATVLALLVIGGLAKFAGFASEVHWHNLTNPFRLATLGTALFALNYAARSLIRESRNLYAIFRR